MQLLLHGRLAQRRHLKFLLPQNTGWTRRVLLRAAPFSDSLILNPSEFGLFIITQQTRLPEPPPP